MSRALDGVVVVDKPIGPTSFAIVKAARRLTGARKVGHGGTLDPAASGVLPICFGEATKLAQFLLDADKEYLATVRFGTETDTYDATGAVTARASAAALTAEGVGAALRAFLGAGLQVPPMYSALKRDGRPLYDYARAGETLDRPARAVRIDVAELVGFDDAGTEAPGARVRVRCSKGTYIRALAFDLGRAVGTGAHLEALRRTRSGPFTLEGAVTPEQLAGDPLPVVSPAGALAHLATVTLTPEQVPLVTQGKRLPWADVGIPVGGEDQGGGKPDERLVRLLSPGGALVAVAPRGTGDDPVRTLRVFNCGP